MASLRSHIYVCLALALPFASTHAQQVDTQAMMKWGAADVVHYHIVGEYQDQPSIASDGSGIAEVRDRVVIDLTWKLSEAKLVGVPTFQNTKTTVTNPRDREPSCLAPALKGEYEHFELLAIKDGLGGALELQVKTTYPIVEVAQLCTANRKSVPASVKARSEQFVVPSPVMLAMPIPPSDELSVSSDKKSFIRKKSGWTWTYTPRI
ncbi:MAG TPA: hypothetical protein VK629_16510 [Steroidobacteraceae bacterium]|nr:hypothetical protein [Steroidobacteraceae bacterium]